MLLMLLLFMLQKLLWFDTDPLMFADRCRTGVEVLTILQAAILGMVTIYEPAEP